MLEASPAVESVEQARLIVQSAKYPPVGRRGAAFGVAHDDYSGGDVGEKIRSQIVRPMIRAAGAGPQVRLIGLAGDNFYDKLIGHAEVRQTYMNWSAAAAIPNP